MSCVVMSITNWSGTITFSTAGMQRPANVDELRSLVARSPSCRVLGSGHSFSRIADTSGTLISLSEFSRCIDIDSTAKTVTISGGIRYGELAVALQRAGFALRNLASLPHITVAGSCATGTHGSGASNGPLSSSVVATEFVSASGDLIRMGRGEPNFEGAIVSLGALGVVTAMTLAIEPSFDVAQHVFTDLPTAFAVDNLDEILSLAYSVSLFTSWTSDVIDQVWIKHRQGDALADFEILREAGARPATRRLHPVPGIDAESCTPQQGVPGPWHERLPHFSLDFTPSAGDEIQSECFVSRVDGPAAMAALLAIGEEIGGPLLVSEIRSVAADEQWLSMSHARDSVAFHFTWCSDPFRVLPAVAAIERALAPFAPRPHWGKVTAMKPSLVGESYPRWNDARAFVMQTDPDGVFANEFTRSLFATN